jgi:hypothetical protein
MKLSNRQRLTKLAENLISHPSYWMRYIHSVPAWGKRPFDVGLPWWSFAAIDFMESWLTGNEDVFEYGSGGSTLFFSRLSSTVHAVEDHRGWASEVKQRLVSGQLTNTTVYLQEYDFRSPSDFDESSYFKALDQAYDVIVVDGQDWNFEIRPICFHRAEKYIKPGGVIIVDDSWRYTALRVNNSAKKFEVFESVGPCRYGVTSTDVYFY